MWLTLHMYPDIIQKRYLFKVENALHILFNLSQLQTFLISVFWSAVLKLLQILVIYSALLCIRSYYSKCIIRFYWSPTVYIWLLSCPFGGKLNCFLHQILCTLQPVRKHSKKQDKLPVVVNTCLKLTAPSWPILLSAALGFNERHHGLFYLSLEYKKTRFLLSIL